MLKNNFTILTIVRGLEEELEIQTVEFTCQQDGAQPTASMPVR